MAGSGLLWVFLISLSVTVVFCWNGDDDVVYRFFERKPTGTETMQRIRFLFAKFSTVFSGSGFLIIFLAKMLIGHTNVPISINLNKTALMFLVAMAIEWAFIGVVKNQIRRFQGRIPRPVFDLSVALFNISLWWNPRK